ncbi:hypothetical protein OSB04_025972 [Centaurea solstitialis]|uniref:Uncharacterized protein n=1 Tax=Centaurea solstitialis TaxID=347529 RepID=A0AA38T1C6_9ASTR|nr:hypothetical protein OSB04_025972 [Centaurea solstitialis]
MSIATSAIAEAYVMRKCYQENMKKTTPDAQGTTKESMLDNDDHASMPIGCFPRLFRKIHSTTSSTVHVSDSSPRLSQELKT